MARRIPVPISVVVLSGMLAVCGIAIGILVGAVVAQDDTAEVIAQDRVVGVEYRCDSYYLGVLGCHFQEVPYELIRSGTLSPSDFLRHWVGGDPCNHCRYRKDVFNRQMDLTVRSAAGDSTYVVGVTPHRNYDDFPEVRVGDVWPPPQGVILPAAPISPAC
jgi:hypothetical protein